MTDPEGKGKVKGKAIGAGAGLAGVDETTTDSSARAARTKMNLKSIGVVTRLHDMTLYRGTGPYGAYYMLGNDNVVVFLNEGTFAYRQLKTVEERLRNAVFDIEFTPVRTKSGRTLVQVSGVWIKGKREMKVPEPELHEDSEIGAGGEVLA